MEEDLALASGPLLQSQVSTWSWKGKEGCGLVQWRTGRGLSTSYLLPSLLTLLTTTSFNLYSNQLNGVFSYLFRVLDQEAEI